MLLKCSCTSEPKRVSVRGDITVFRGTFNFDNFYFNYHTEANQVKFFRFLDSNSAPPVCTTPGCGVRSEKTKKTWPR